MRSSKPALDERLSAEIATLGFPVRGVDPPQAGAEPSAASLQDIARARGATAAVRVLERDDAIEVWVEGPADTVPPFHEVFRSDARRRWNVASVSALESLRAHLLGRPPPQLSPAAPEVAPLRPEIAAPHGQPAFPRRPWLWLHLAAGAESSPGGLGPASEIFGEVRVELPSSAPLGVDVSVFGAFSPVAAQVAGPEGIAYVRHEIAGAAADARARLGRANVSLGLGAVLGLFSMNGQPSGGAYSGHDASIATLGPVLRACAAFDIVHALRVRAELAGGVTVPHAVIQFAGREVADWGQPFGLVTLGVKAAFSSRAPKKTSEPKVRPRAS